jgi:Putative zinc- or iron-chelating domain
MQERLDRAKRRQLLKEDQAWIGKAVDLTEPRTIQANTRHLTLMLLDTGIKRRASKAAAFASQLLDTTMTKLDPKPVACSKGCYYCCKTYVSVTIPEALRLAQSVRKQADKSARIAEAAAASAVIPQSEREVRRVVCPILQDNVCSEYLVRPVVCRAVLSKSLDTCLRIFEQNSGEPFPFTDDTTDVRVYIVAILQAALMMSGLSPLHYEMNQALAVALAHEDAEDRWLAGDALFTDVPVDEADIKPSGLSAMIRALVANVRPTL